MLNIDSGSFPHKNSTVSVPSTTSTTNLPPCFFFFLYQTCYEMERYLKDEPQQPSSSPLCSSALRRAESFDMLSSIQPAGCLAPDSVNSPMWPWSFKQEPADPDTDPDDGCQLLRAHKHQIALRYGLEWFFLSFSEGGLFDMWHSGG